MFMAIGDREKDQTRLARLVQKGIVRPGGAALPSDFFSEQLPRLKENASVVEALLEERRNGR
jgi:hypothetical protein